MEETSMDSNDYEHHGNHIELLHGDGARQWGDFPIARNVLAH